MDYGLDLDVRTVREGTSGDVRAAARTLDACLRSVEVTLMDAGCS